MDSVNKKFGRLLILSVLDGDAVCLCDCGTPVTTKLSKIVSGNNKSCGCLKKELSVRFGQANKTHGCANSARSGYANRTYGIWQAFRDRCNNANRKDYKYYGGRGVSYQSSWDDYSEFINDMGEAPEGLTIDRIDVEKGYSKENCRWAPRKQQGRNTRKSLKVLIDGETVVVRDYIEAVGIPLDRFRKRYYSYGWTLREACGLDVRGARNCQ